MITTDQFRALQAGDVFYRGSTRYEIESITHKPDVEQVFYWGTQLVPEATARAMSKKSSNGRVYKGYVTFTNLHPSAIEKVVPKEKTRGTREYKSRRNYPFVKLQDQTELQRTERNDCSVHALTIYLDIPYADAHSHMKAYGRINGKGARVHSAYPAKGLQYRSNLTGFAFGRLIKSGLLPERSIVLTKRHAVCVLSGVVHDGIKIGQNTAVLGWYSNVNA